MADLVLGGIFEDACQADFHCGFLEGQAERSGVSVELCVRLTKGCRLDWLHTHARELAPTCHALLVGVDGKKLAPEEKRRALEPHLGKPEVPTIWAVARPSIEAWMMADPEAVPSALAHRFGGVNRTATRPEVPRAEERAKRALSAWTQALLGEPLGRGGREYAREVGRLVRIDHVPMRRHEDLHAHAQAVRQVLSQRPPVRPPPER